MIAVNKIYGYLTDGDSTERHTSCSREQLSTEAKTLLNILVPSDADEVSRRGLAELYIRLCFTDKSLAAKLLDVDPVNSYKLHSFHSTIAQNIELSSIIENIRKSGIIDTEITALPVDHIIRALTWLLDALNNG